jgi:hypothetical protein
MGLWGDQDASEISDNPFFVEEGAYVSNLTQFELRHNEQRETDSILMQWTIEEEDSDYEGDNVSDWINVYLTSEARQAADKASLRRDQARLKSRLTAIGMSNDEMNELVDDEGNFNEELAEKYIGTLRVVEVKVRPGKGSNEDKKYSNIVGVHDLDE